ncbi:MAG: DPP IV N-terminal domain-containing protein [Bacteroidetes bacterium]|nr:DPP IV N-terminal domain-containing protein [Bacteroidota bacterium]
MQKLIRSLFIAILFTGSLLAQKNFTLEHVILESASLSPKRLSQLQWIPDTDAFTHVITVDEETNLIKENASSEGKEILLTLTKLNDALTGKSFNTLESFPIFKWTNNSTIRFWDYLSLVEYNLNNNSLTIINDIANNGTNADFNDPHKIAYTIDNNLYIAINSKQIQITKDENIEIVNGQFVHRHEFGIEKGTFWSPKNNYIAFYRKDESMVTDYPVIDISKKPAVIENIKYPMAGMTSEEVTVGVYDLKTGKTVWLKTGEPKDHYLPGVTWSPDERYIYIAELNRDQNHMNLTKYNARTGEMIKILFEETSDKYVEPMNDLIFFEDEPDMFIWTTRKDGWNHFYLYDAQGAKIKQLTKGEWEVTNFDGLSTVGYNIFFAAAEQSPTESHYYKVDFDRYEMKRITNGAGIHKIIRNEKGTMFLDVFTNVDVPYEVSVLDKDGEKLRTVFLAPNPFEGFNTGKTEIFTLKSSDGSDLYCRTIFPPGFDENKKYPVLVYVYGGPHIQRITNRWLGGTKEILWLNYMAQNGYIVFTLDNRGSSNRGLEFEQKIFRQLGTVEIEDQMVGVNYLKSLSYVDTTSMGVFGWSYGGFMTTSLMTRRPGVFKVGIAGGTVIDWQYYEVMYTERYMDSPQQNPEGYEEANLLNYVNDLKGKLLMVHGTSDPTVVWQHTLMFIQKATQLGIEIDYFPYVGHKHGVKGTDKFHLYQKITNYFNDNL